MSTASNLSSFFLEFTRRVDALSSDRIRSYLLHQGYEEYRSFSPLGTTFLFEKGQDEFFREEILLPINDQVSDAALRKGQALTILAAREGIGELGLLTKISAFRKIAPRAAPETLPEMPRES